MLENRTIPFIRINPDCGGHARSCASELYSICGCKQWKLDGESSDQHTCRTSHARLGSVVDHPNIHSDSCKPVGSQKEKI